MREYRFTQPYDLDRTVDAYEIHTHVSRSQSERRNIFLILAVTFLALTWALFGMRSDTGLAAYWPWIPLSLGLSALIAWFPRRWNRVGLKGQLATRMKQLGIEEGQTTYVFDDEQMRIEDDYVGGKFAWSDLYAWHDGPDYLLIYRAPQFFYSIVKADVDTESLSALVQRLKSSPAKQL